MRISSLNVYVEYRYKADDAIPQDKALRARVYSDTPENRVYGTELICPRRIYNSRDAVILVAQKLCESCENLIVEFDPLMNLPVEIIQMKPKIL